MCKGKKTPRMSFHPSMNGIPLLEVVLYLNFKLDLNLSLYEIAH